MALYMSEAWDVTSWRIAMFLKGGGFKMNCKHYNLRRKKGAKSCNHASY